MIYKMKKKKKESGFWKKLKSLMVMKKRLSTGSGGMDTKIREKKDRGIFWEAEADILREELLDEQYRRVRNIRN